MSRLRVASIATLLGLVWLATSPDTWAQEAAAPKKIKVERGPCVVEVALKGVVEAREMTEVILRPEVWSSFTALSVVPHGSRVKKGDSLMKMDMTKIEEAIADQTDTLRSAELTLQLAEQELAALEKLTQLDLAASQRTFEEGREDLERFLKVDRPASEEQAHHSVKNAQHYVEYAAEELRQLEKMYKAKDLTEETEEIILKRQRHQLENAQFWLKNSERSRDQTLNTHLPRQEQKLRESANRHAIAYDKAKITLPLSLEQKKFEVERQRRELAKSRRRLERLKSDAQLMAVAAPADGLVFYGRCMRGTWLQSAEMERAFNAGQVPTGVVLFTIVQPSSVVIRAAAEEKDFELLAVDQSAKIVPTALPRLKALGKLATLGRTLTPSGGFDVTLHFEKDQPPEGLLPGYSVTAKVKVYEKSDALLLPATAVFAEEHDEDAKYVWLAGAEPQKRPVKLGQKMAGKVEILEGLTEGDEVLAEKPAPKKGK
jgi:HlyD family secretion protein